MTDRAAGATIGQDPPMAGAEARDRVLAHVPVTGLRIDAAGVSTALLEGGSGSPLLLVHGGIESGGAYGHQ